MNNLLTTLLLVAVSACHGSCDRPTAARRASEPGAACYLNSDGDAVCLGRESVYACSTVGLTTFDATCHRIGTVTISTPAPMTDNEAK